MSIITSLILGMFFVASVSAAPTNEELADIIKQQQERIDALEGAMEGGGGMVDGWWTRTSIGGYGEVHIEGGDYSGDSADAHRFVLFFNHDYSDSIRLFSEFELEHALAADGEVGEVELEQAYIEMDLAPNKQLKNRYFLNTCRYT